MVMSPNILEVMSFRVGVFYAVTATTVCCILMQILCVVSWKSPRPLPYSIQACKDIWDPSHPVTTVHKRHRQTDTGIIR